jgi:hypothetical protein
LIHVTLDVCMRTHHVEWVLIQYHMYSYVDADT